MSILDLTKARPRTQTIYYKKVPADSGTFCYVAIGAELNSALDTRYFVKIGKAINPEKRTFNQRLLMVAFADNRYVRGTAHAFDGVELDVIAARALETYLLRKAQDTYGVRENNMCAGWTEMVGNFLQAEEALKAAEILISTIYELNDRAVFRYDKTEFEWCSTLAYTLTADGPCC